MRIPILNYLVVASMMLTLTLFTSCNNNSGATDSVIPENSREPEKEETSTYPLFEANEDVARYNNSKVPEFESYDYENLFAYSFPVKPEFEISESSGPKNFYASELYEGTIYTLKISDYGSISKSV
ncbi:MAG: hypothetical protein IPM74_03010 [Crocinitomicaceae bacterium]|nr:hypothetical protein [Crocinitomicaceae bacterium]MBK8924886.1 hypothetical protein [Crocinitomicaceae bacterium]